MERLKTKISELLIKGEDVSDEKSLSHKSAFCEISLLVRRGHGEGCEDSAFVYCDGEMAIMGIFDGVGGEPGGASASAQAASTILSFLKRNAAKEAMATDNKSPAKKIPQSRNDEELVKAAFLEANLNVTTGYTTAVVLLVRKDGSFVMCGVGDSPVYGIDRKGAVTSLLPLARAVGAGDSVMRYFHYRNLVTSVLGRTGGETDLAVRCGRLNKGEILILASDGLSDNLFITVREGFVKDPSGVQDLEKLIESDRSASKITKKLSLTVKERVLGLRIEKSGRLLIPKEDDLSICAFKML